MSRRPLMTAPIILCAGLFVLPACGDDGPSSATCDMPGGMVSGADDSHCGSTVVTVDQGACTPDMADAGPGAADAGADTGDDYGDTLYGTSGDDDDCKYHVTWSSTTVCENQAVTFHVHLTAKDGGAPELGAMPYIEAFLNDTHPAPNSGATFTDKGGGDYDIGPMTFDAAGRWTVRFHFFSNCTDSETSPHGHAAFFVDVP